MSPRGSATLFERRGGKDIPVHSDPVMTFGFQVKPHTDVHILVQNVCAGQIHVTGRERPINTGYNGIVERGAQFSVGDRRFICR